MQHHSIGPLRAGCVPGRSVYYMAALRPLRAAYMPGARDEPWPWPVVTLSHS